MDQFVGVEPSGAVMELRVRRGKLWESFPDNRLIRDILFELGELIWEAVSETVDIDGALNSEETSPIDSSGRSQRDLLVGKPLKSSFKKKLRIASADFFFSSSALHH